MSQYRVLSLDGGGVKGLFTAILLSRLEAARPGFLAHAHLLAGTSTGGILALGLASGRTPDELATMYREHSPRIFDDSLWDNIIDLGKAIGADYKLDGLKRALRTTFARDLRLGDLRRKVLIPTFDLDCPAEGDRPRMWKPKFFHNYAGPDSDGDERVIDVATRTSAAPTYFPAYQGYVDGGVVANNPSMAALAQAIGSNGAKKRLEDVALLSLGTGTEPTFLKGQSLNWGWAQWARPMTSLMMSGLTGVADYQCRQLLGPRYTRLTTYFDRAVRMDDARTETLEYLEARARAVEIESTVRWLEQHDW